MHGDIRCEICNRPISKGRYCDACMIKINQNIADMFSGVTVEQKKGTKMHISEDRKK